MIVRKKRRHTCLPSGLPSVSGGEGGKGTSMLFNTVQTSLFGRQDKIGRLQPIDGILNMLLTLVIRY